MLLPGKQAERPHPTPGPRGPSAQDRRSPRDTEKNSRCLWELGIPRAEMEGREERAAQGRHGAG